MEDLNELFKQKIEDADWTAKQEQILPTAARSIHI